jgi:hypothetical protein
MYKNNNKDTEQCTLHSVMNSNLNEYYNKRKKIEEKFNNQYYPNRMNNAIEKLNNDFINTIINI